MAKRITYGEVLLWIVSATFNMYCMGWEPDCMNNSFRRFYMKASAMTKNDALLCDVWAKMLKDGKSV